MAKKKRKTTCSLNKKTKPIATPPRAFPDSLLKTKTINHHKPDRGIVSLHRGAVVSLPNFFSPHECNSWIEFCSSNKMDHVSHPATRYVAHRECHRMQVDDAFMAERLYERMRPFLPELSTCLDVSGRAVGCNANLRLYRYDRGMSFGKHVDGSNWIERLGGNTEVTVLIYLSGCGGGATRFYPPKGEKGAFAFEPQPGAVLFHVHGDQCLEHEGDVVQHGVKYILRTDLVYAKR